MRYSQTEFIEYCLAQGVLRFGEFTLKSGRTSPYFFNAGLFNSGARLAVLTRHYAEAIQATGIEFDVLFGPAYKGIPLAAGTAVQLASEFDRDVPWGFNRKEAKDHGEGGVFVGTEPHGRVLVIDDVITAGTAIREVASLLDSVDAQLAGVVVAVDRQERGQSELSAIGEVEADLGVRVHAIVQFDDIIEYLRHTGEFAEYLPAVLDYRDRYGIL